MSEGYKIRDQKGVYYLTFQVVSWIDVFTRKVYRDIIIDSFRYCQEVKGLKIYAFVIMSNHIHCILSSGEQDLSTTIKEFKSFTSKKIIDTIETGNESRKEWMLELFKTAAIKHKRNSNYQFWRHDNHPVELTSNKFIDQKPDYIHNNPIIAGIVEQPEDYLYSSARNYADMISILKTEPAI